MSEALANSAFRPTDLDYICAHGPSHPVIDQVETSMIKKVLHGHAYRIPVSSIKGVIGNPMSAAGPLQIAAVAMAIRHHMVPPTANFQDRDPDCDLDYVPNRPYAVSINRALVNVHGLGGGNSSLVVSRVASA
jgi:3-oxoacyl-(acyl-carrier-protein) synthase